MGDVCWGDHRWNGPKWLPWAFIADSITVNRLRPHNTHVLAHVSKIRNKIGGMTSEITDEKKDYKDRLCTIVCQ